LDAAGPSLSFAEAAMSPADFAAELAASPAELAFLRATMRVLTKRSWRRGTARERQRDIVRSICLCRAVRRRVDWRYFSKKLTDKRLRMIERFYPTVSFLALNSHVQWHSSPRLSVALRQRGAYINQRTTSFSILHPTLSLSHLSKFYIPHCCPLCSCDCDSLPFSPAAWTFTA
jgi:hypothetical protein